MANLHRHNPLLKQKLQVHITSRNAEAMLAALSALSVADFRTAGYLLSEELLTQLTGDDFWTFFLVIVPTDTKAYLGTFLKAGVVLYRQQKLSLSESSLTAFSEIATAIDSRKMLDAFLSVVRSPQEVEMLIRIFSRLETESATLALFRAGTVQTYYVLFKLMRTIDSRPDLLRRYVLALMKKGDALSFNLASVMCQYFDLRDIPGRFSLHLQPYELGRLDQGFSTFEKILCR